MNATRTRRQHATIAPHYNIVAALRTACFARALYRTAHPAWRYRVRSRIMRLGSVPAVLCAAFVCAAGTAFACPYLGTTS